MTPLIITVILCLIALLIMAYGIARHGWSNGYYLTIILVIAAVVMGLIGYTI